MFYLIFLLTLFLDQLTKFLALQYLSSADTLGIIPNIFHLTLVHNTGIAFGFFRQHPQLLLVLITGSLAALFVWGWKLSREKNQESLLIALVLGGAAGNWIDRLRFGAVIDFLDFRVWPVFNLADSAITVGVALFAWSLLRKKKG